MAPPSEAAVLHSGEAIRIKLTAIIATRRIRSDRGRPSHSSQGEILLRKRNLTRMLLRIAANIAKLPELLSRRQAWRE
jgi:hypothetical protein